MRVSRGAAKARHSRIPGGRESLAIDESRLDRLCHRRAIPASIEQSLQAAGLRRGFAVVLAVVFVAVIKNLEPPRRNVNP